MDIIHFVDILLPELLYGRPGSVGFNSNGIYILNTAYNTDMYICTKNKIDLTNKSKLLINFTDNGGWTYSGRYTSYSSVLLSNSTTGNYRDSWPSGLEVLKKQAIGPSNGVTRTITMDISDFSGSAVIGFYSQYSGNCTVNWITIE